MTLIEKMRPSRERAFARRASNLDRKALKAEYLDCLAARTSSTHTLQEVIKHLLGLGVLRQTMFQWGVAAGYGETTVRTWLSRAFCALGVRQRKAGAGRKPSPEALELLAHSRQSYGDRALQVLRAAYRAGKTPEAGATIADPQLRCSTLIVGPQLLPADRKLRSVNRNYTSQRTWTRSPKPFAQAVRKQQSVRPPMRDGRAYRQNLST